MKLLFINSVYNWGSTGKIVASLRAYCQNEGIETAVCYGRTMTEVKPLPEKNIFQFGLDSETKLHALLTRITGRTGCFSFFSTRRLIKFIEEFKPDVIHLHELHAYFLDLKPFFNYLKKCDIPIVYTFHCEFAFTGKCGHPLECENWRTGCGNCPHLRDYPKTFLFDCTRSMLREKKELLSKQKMIIVSPSKWLADRTKQTFLSPYPVYVINNGIDTEIFRPRDPQRLRSKLGLNDEKVILAVAPDLSDRLKGIAHVLKLAERFKDENVRFIIVGKKRESNVFPNNVTAVGRTENQAELAEYYSLADCFVICSLIENLPTTCLEAVSCGTPVAGFDVGGTAETAPPSLGRFCAYADIDALEANVRYFLEHKIEEKLFTCALKNNSLDNMFQEYMKVYDEAFKMCVRTK